VTAGIIVGVVIIVALHAFYTIRLLQIDESGEEPQDDETQTEEEGQ